VDSVTRPRIGDIKSRKVDFTTPITESWEYATSSTERRLLRLPVQIGDKIKTDAFIKVRVTTYGDFAVQDYRLRAIAGMWIVRIVGMRVWYRALWLVTLW